VKIILGIIAALVIIAILVVGLSMAGYLDIDIPFIPEQTTTPDEEKFVGSWDIISVDGLTDWDDYIDACVTFSDGDVGQLLIRQDDASWGVAGTFTYTFTADGNLLLGMEGRYINLAFGFSDNDRTMILTGINDDTNMVLKTVCCCGG